MQWVENSPNLRINLALEVSQAPSLVAKAPTAEGVTVAVVAGSRASLWVAYLVEASLQAVNLARPLVAMAKVG